MQREKMLASNRTLTSQKALHKSQKQTGQAFLVLDGPSRVSGAAYEGGLRKQ